ncbi:MAG: hypothetical protein K6F10_05735 [Paludibacteraceae bacterium]|nr:hypothetical protein [Paludibacteraceae bacterium]
MKKFFSLFAAVLFASSMMAAVITLDPATQTPVSTEDTQNGEAISLTINGIAISYNGTLNAATETAPADFRVFGGKTLTLSASVNITKVVIAGKANKENFALTSNKGTVTTGASYEAKTEKKEIDDPLIVVENINAQTVVLTPSKQLRAYTIQVTIDGESSTGGEGGGQGGGEEGGEVNLDVVYCEAALIEDTEGTYWQLNLYKDYDYESGVLTYPDLWIGVEPKSETGIAGTYTEDDIYFVQVYTAAKDSAEATQVSDLVVTRVDDSYYYFSFSFVGDDGKTYIVEAECGTIAYNYETEEDIELDDEISQGIEDIVLTEKAQKVVVDGAVYVIRDNKMYNVTGTRVR